MPLQYTINLHWTTSFPTKGTFIGRCITWLGNGPFRGGGREPCPVALNFLLGTMLGRERKGGGVEGEGEGEGGTQRRGGRGRGDKEGGREGGMERGVEGERRKEETKRREGGTE